ncbi:Bcr/CflA family efflux MFS transporter [Cohaesibacter celericrescens]|uniref:Bcr/CflA family efflux transporter n=1 Tax=Cohaesibacter celericrescens TaxID=2067669 RepID=A0A2N5XM30_9HYPH|nr:Bcr/CflA family efflux MFS transporter [Cohaesibacter celericrescens]PLW75579.1 MFS transporter [Cohaesibacter celericrescens]
MKIAQPSLGKRGTAFLLIALGAFPPLTIDLYLPALPQMTKTFATSQGMVNLTLAAYMIAFSIGILFWGPLSERTGRKPILFMTLSLYIAASLLCALAFQIEYLIGFRILQGFAGGGVAVVGTTIVKDLFDRREREQVMAVIMSLGIIAPMVAPVLGAFLLKIASWHMMFVALAVFASFVFVLVIFYQETLEERSTGPLYKSWLRLGVVVLNPRFAYLLLIFSAAPMCLMSFLGIAAYVYVDGFGMSEQAFSFIFAFNAACATIGPILYLRLSRRIKVETIIQGCFGVIVLAGIAMLLVGSVSPWLFAAVAALNTVAVIVLRVPGANLLLEQQTFDTGSAAALIQFSGTIMGALGIQIVSSRSDNLIQSYGVLLVVVGAICAMLWFLVRNKPFVAEKVTKPLEV